MIDMDKMISLAEKYNLPPKARNNHNLNEFPPPPDHIGYVYLWKNLDCGKEYIGGGFDPLGNGYSHTSENEEFKRDLENPNIDWEYRIMKYIFTNKNDVRREESMILLSKNDPATGKGGAAANSMFYNNSNGILGKGQTVQGLSDLDKILELKKFIGDKPEEDEVIRQVNNLYIKFLKEDARIQFRTKDDGDHADGIEMKISEAGNTSKCSPILIFQNIMYRGVLYPEILGNGTHTITAARKSKSLDLKCILVDEKTIKEYIPNYDDSMLEALVSSFHTPREDLELHNTYKDFKKWLNNKYIEKVKSDPNYDLDCDENKEYGKIIYGLSGPKSRYGCKAVKKKIEDNKPDPLGALWIDYKMPHYKSNIKKKKNLLKSQPGVEVRSWTATQIKQAAWHEVLSDLVRISEDNKISKKDKICTYIILVHFQSSTQEQGWKFDKIKAMTNFLSGNDVTVVIQYMDHIKSV